MPFAGFVNRVHQIGPAPQFHAAMLGVCRMARVEGFRLLRPQRSRCSTASGQAAAARTGAWQAPLPRGWDPEDDPCCCLLTVGNLETSPF